MLRKTLFTHATSRSDKNSLMHLTERRNDKKAINCNNNDDDSNNLNSLFLNHLSVIQTASNNNFDIPNLFISVKIIIIKKTNHC